MTIGVFAAVQCRTAWRLRCRLCRLFRLRRDLAKLLLLADRHGEERMASGTGILHRRLLHRRPSRVQPGAARA